MGSPNLVSTTNDMQHFNKIPSECPGIIPQLPIMLGGKTVLVDLLVVPGPLEFNFIHGHNYVYVMNAVVSTLFFVMHFTHKGIFVIIDQISFDNHHPGLALPQVSPLCVPSVRVDSSPPWVNYVASYPQCSISPKKDNLQVNSPSQDKVSKIDKMFYPMGAWEPSVITEISSAHGDKNSASSNCNEVIHGTELISQHSKKVKNYTK
jgi:hypothetical protein